MEKNPKGNKLQERIVGILDSDVSSTDETKGLKISEENRRKFYLNAVDELKKTGEKMVDWRCGWNFNPSSPEEVMDMLEQLAIAFHTDWLVAMENGDAPHEDVSPGEPFISARTIILGMNEKLDAIRKELEK